MPQCDWMDVDQIWACMTPQEDSGQHRQVGCEVGCKPCVQHPNNLQSDLGTSDRGTRWLRPPVRRPGSVRDLEARHADGVRRPMRSGITYRLPNATTTWELAACWNPSTDEEQYDFSEPPQQEPEGAGEGICSCRPQDCPECPHAPLYAEGWRHTCDVFDGMTWPPIGFQCTGRFLGDVPILVRMRGSRLGAGAFARTGEIGYTFDVRTGCTENVGVICWGAREESPCSIEDEPTDAFYNPRPGSSIFDYFRIHNIGVRFVQDPAAPADYRAAIDIKNAAMEWLEADRALGFGGIAHFDQIDSARRRGLASNSSLDFWSRGWDGFQGRDSGVPWDELPAVAELPFCYLLNTRHLVHVEIVAVRASIELVLDLPRVRTVDPLALVPGSIGFNNIYPVARMRISMDLGVRARFASSGTHYLTPSWERDPEPIPLAIHNPGEAHSPVAVPGRLPRVAPSGLDQIVYVKNGVAFQPPIKAVAELHLGRLSDPVTEQIFDHDFWDDEDTGHLRVYCCTVARGIDGLVFPAMESDPDKEEGNRKRIWEGGVTIGVPMGTLCD